MGAACVCERFNPMSDNCIPVPNAGSSYSGSNGIKINAIGTLEYIITELWTQLDYAKKPTQALNMFKLKSNSTKCSATEIIEITPPNINTAPVALLH